MGVDDAHYGPHAIVKGAAGTVRLEFVVLDEVDPDFAQRLGQGRRVFRSQADARLDDGADQRAFLHAREPARAGDTEFRAGIAFRERVRQPQVEQAQAGDLFQLEQVAGDRGEQIGERWP